MSSLGDRLRKLRKLRGLSQRDLAVQAGLSVSLVRKLEQGEREDTRIETLRKLAVALRIPTTKLMSDEQQAYTENDAQSEVWTSLLQAINNSEEDTSTEPPPTPNGLAQAIKAAVRLYHEDKYTDLLTVLPMLSRDANALVASDSGTGSPLRARTMQVIGSLATQTRKFDAAEASLEKAMADAENTGNRIEVASAVITWCWLLLRQRRLEEARTLAVEWADAIEPRLSKATDTEIAAWGWLLLRGSAAAIRDNRSDEAEDMMRLALAGAVRIGREHGDYHEYFTTFGPATVQMKRVENAIVDADPARALRLSVQVPKTLRVTSNNRNRHMLDVANAHVMMHEYNEALSMLWRLKNEAAEWLPNQQYVRDILSTITDKRRTLTAEMREMADFVHLEL
ncbi:helix-turn-helix domain-containing protein [Nonomuraea typhae]|uniref:Helix-turn-helix domain-containing protein n=1 Tax=Nonomuraea typhae TaxID=2603600 RepID=A0ABW7YWF2_9ACTN